jgi:hypothetical protein
VSDLVFAGILVMFFAASWGFVLACERLKESGV